MKLYLTIFAMMSLIPGFSKGAPLEPGADAPKVSAPDQSGRTINFADVYASGPTLVYFYPKADTPGCTAQACSLRDSYSELQSDGLTILGVSTDSPESQKKFQDKYELPFTLIADQGGAVAEAFGVPRTMGFTARQSFLIRDGKVVWSTTKAKTKDHAKEIQAALAASD